MRTEEMIHVLEKAQEAILEFELPTGQLIRSDYHITEFKNTSIRSVDCGGKTNEWNEVVIQLWEPPLKGDGLQIGDDVFSDTGGEANGSMTADKALAIMARVEKSLELFRGVDLKFEFGNADYRLAQHSISSVKEGDGRLLIGLGAGESECKGLSSGACGVPKAKVAMSEIGGQAEACCTPGGGCC